MLRGHFLFVNGYRGEMNEKKNVSVSNMDQCLLFELESSRFGNLFCYDNRMELQITVHPNSKGTANSDNSKVCAAVWYNNNYLHSIISLIMCVRSFRFLIEIDNY